ncbi:hypothetical protein [Cytophaga hutchinsonii]|jgi:hypothetical protein|uniref:Phytanoyl-CoA dioxygenase n=1 Tax=Cytophaga hutchinsonii (strain ATCC 33406 / DSM 1761 / CIP 103989 / NBRC 15051 / NCIMB 9469 / D465) TaxID=269798 RepID=A0A6N4SUF8_CYTH3|nr:hypothetical protein [Cytophaga hutchinsonii]ABG60017.1 hypothetical protein CHU_2767 [Cytophaga hutchinsonii ATCC 33406]SFX25608.1 hypothetical protein SAMN04487930_102286 [Cytophaga hutchinsonii ATCC 33406]
MNSSSDFVESFHNNGFAIVKGVFSKSEIQTLRNEVASQVEIDKAKGLIYSVPNSSATYVKGDLLSKELLQHVILDERVINIAKKILQNEPVYFGDGSYQIGTGLRGYHRDNTDRVFNVGNDWAADYSIIRMGLYLQNHKKYSGGLKVRIASNKNKSGKSVLLDIEEGDLVFWDLRTLHSGNAVRLKMLPNFPVDYLEKNVPDFLKIDEDNVRMAFFFSFGKKDAHLERYLKNSLLKSANMVEGLKQSPISSAVFADAANKGLTIVKPIAEYGN